MDDKIILEYRFSSHQKTHIIFFIGSPLILIIYSLMKINLNNVGLSVLFLLIVIYLSLVCLAFTRRGLLKKGSELHRGLFFFKKLILKKKIDLTNKSKIAILKFNKTQKMGWFSAARPDLSLGFSSLDINLLNKKHTKRETLISLTDNEKATRAVEFLEAKFELKNEKYSPDFS